MTEKINPFSLTMPDKRYWSVSEYPARAWSGPREGFDKHSKTGGGES